MYLVSALSCSTLFRHSRVVPYLGTNKRIHSKHIASCNEGMCSTLFKHSCVVPCLSTHDTCRWHASASHRARARAQAVAHHHIHCHIIIFIVTSSYSMTVQAVEHHTVQGGSQAAGKCRHHTAQGLRAREQVPQVRADGMCQHHIAQ